MNIFVLDTDIPTCAQYHCDKHVVKMITEYCQLLSTCMHTLGYEYAPYKPTHKNHPCGVWVKESRSNYEWLWKLADEVGKEYTSRYKKLHLSHLRLLNDIPVTLKKLPDQGLTPFVNCTEHKHIDDVVEAYRESYLTDKAHFVKWKASKIPYWFSLKVDSYFDINKLIPLWG